ncbi:hypothetical protein LINPERHAP2_LOCUS22758 [Linum perenne]
MHAIRLASIKPPLPDRMSTAESVRRRDHSHRRRFAFFLVVVVCVDSLLPSRCHHRWRPSLDSPSPSAVWSNNAIQNRPAGPLPNN